MNLELLAAFVFLIVTLVDISADTRGWKLGVVIPAMLLALPGIFWGFWDLFTSPRSVSKRIQLAFWKLMFTDHCEEKLCKRRMQGKPLYRNPFYNCSVLCKHGQWLTYTKHEPALTFKHENWEDRFAILGFYKESDRQEARTLLGKEVVKVKPSFIAEDLELLDVTKKDLLRLEKFPGRFWFSIRVNFPNTPVIVNYFSEAAPKGRCKMRVHYDAIGDHEVSYVDSSLTSFVFFIDTLLFIQNRERHCFVVESIRPSLWGESWGYQLCPTSLKDLQKRICAEEEKIGFTRIHDKGVKYTE